MTASPVWAQSSSSDDAIAEYRAMFGNDNPAQLWEERGALLWAQTRGPHHVGLAHSCDLGLGVGIVKGAYAQLPRYFADSGLVQDLESRLVQCLSRLGVATDDLLRDRFGDGDRKSDLESLAAYVVGQSRGDRVTLPLRRAAERQAYSLGKAIFYYRAGTHDFSCATCHSQDGKRIRLQHLPNLTKSEGAGAAYTSWPAYRVSQGEVRTMEWRLTDCFRQQRLPELAYGSEAAIALTLFLAKNAEGATMAAPALKR